LSVTLPNNPAEVLNVTVPPLVTKLLLFASLACTVTVEVLVPLAVIEAGLALIVVLAALKGAEAKTTEAGLPIAPPAMVPVMLPVPTVAGEVNVAV
jgi:hypothetical protein